MSYTPGIMVLLAAMAARCFGAQPAAGPPLPDAPVLSTIPMAVAQPAQPQTGPGIRFAQPVYDFGRVQAGEIVKHTFVFTNAGNRVLEVKSVTPSCGCTTPGNWDRRVEPGQTGNIPVQVATAGFNGPLSKSVTVMCNDSLHSTVVLYLRGAVWRPVDITPSYATFTTIAGASTNTTKTLRIVSNLDESLVLSPPECTNTAFQTEIKTVQPGKLFDLCITFVPPAKDGYIQCPVKIKTSSPKHPVISIDAVAFVQKQVVTSPPQINLQAGPLINMTEYKVAIRGLGGLPLALSEPTVDEPGVELEIQEMQPGRWYNLAAKFPAGFQVPAGKRLEVRVKTNNPQYPVVVLPVNQWARPASTTLARAGGSPTAGPPQFPAPPGIAQPPASPHLIPATPPVLIPPAVLNPLGDADTNGPPLPKN